MPVNQVFSCCVTHLGQSHSGFILKSSLPGKEIVILSPVLVIGAWRLWRANTLLRFGDSLQQRRQTELEISSKIENQKPMAGKKWNVKQFKITVPQLQGICLVQKQIEIIWVIGAWHHYQDISAQAHFHPPFLKTNSNSLCLQPGWLVANTDPHWCPATQDIMVVYVAKWKILHIHLLIRNWSCMIYFLIVKYHFKYFYTYHANQIKFSLLTPSKPSPLCPLCVWTSDWPLASHQRTAANHPLKSLHFGEASSHQSNYYA